MTRSREVNGREDPKEEEGKASGAKHNQSAEEYAQPWANGGLNARGVLIIKYGSPFRIK